MARFGWRVRDGQIGKRSIIAVLAVAARGAQSAAFRGLLGSREAAPGCNSGPYRAFFCLRYCGMYGLPPEKALPGTPLRSLLAYRKELGTFPGDPELYCRDILADLATGKATSKTWELNDGRVISIVNQPLP